MSNALFSKNLEDLKCNLLKSLRFFSIFIYTETNCNFLSPTSMK